MIDFQYLRERNKEKLARLNLPSWKPRGKLLVYDLETPRPGEYYKFVLRDDDHRGSHGNFCGQVVRIVGGDELELYICGSGSSFEEVIHWAMENGVRVINASWSGGAPEFCDFYLKRYTEWGGIFVAAAGNHANCAVDYPARSEYALAVSSTYGDNCYGPEIDITADRNYWIKTIDGLDNPFDGTSCATPVIAACVLYILEAYPHYKLKDVMQFLQDNSVPLEREYNRFFHFPDNFEKGNFSASPVSPVKAFLKALGFFR